MSDETGRNLLFAIQAYQCGFITRDGLLTVLKAWADDRAHPMEDLLREGGLLRDERKLGIVREAVAVHLSDNAGDAAASLRSVCRSAPPDIDLSGLPPDIREAVCGGGSP